MNQFRDSLMSRIVMLIALLLIVSQVAWFSLIRMNDREPSAKQFADHVVSIVNFTKATLTTAAPEQRQALLRELYEEQGILVDAAKSSERSKPLRNGSFPHLIALEIQRQLGPMTKVATQRMGVRALWVSFNIEDDEYWVMVPHAPLRRPFPWAWIGWGALVLIISILSAFLITTRINRPLRALSHAALALSEGRIPSAVNEHGPLEVRRVTQAFNLMIENFQRLAKDREVLLAGVSHDLRTPLARLRIAVEMLHDSDRQLRAGMVEDIDDINAIIEQFVAYAREDDSERPALIDVNALISKLTERYARSGNNVAENLTKLPQIFARPLALQRLLANLIDNALRHGNGMVAIVSGVHDDVVRISVLDRGPGIDAENAAALFRPFARSGSARSGKPGSGLGLAIVERIAKLHGGQIALLNRSGGGLEARLELPLERAEMLAVPAEGVANKPDAEHAQADQ